MLLRRGQASISHTNRKLLPRGELIFDISEGGKMLNKGMDESESVKSRESFVRVSKGPAVSSFKEGQLRLFSSYRGESRSITFFSFLVRGQDVGALRPEGSCHLRRRGGRAKRQSAGASN